MADLQHIMIFEPEATGHQIEYVRYLVAAIGRSLPNAKVILVTTAEASLHPNTRRLTRDFPELVTVRTAPQPSRGNRLLRMLSEFYERQWRQYKSLMLALDQIGVSNIGFLIIPHLEAIGLLQLAFRGHPLRGIPWATVAISIRFHRRARGVAGPLSITDVLQVLFFRKLLRDPTLACFGTIDPFLAQTGRYPKVLYCPEPSAIPVLSNREEARAAYGVRSGACVVLVFGFIDHRKCIGTLLEAAERVSPELDLTVLLAGPQHPREVAQALNGRAAHALRHAGRLVEVNRFILNGQDIDPLSVADISWIFYDTGFVNSSNVMVRSGLARRPVIARRQGVIGRQIEDHRFGIAVPTDDPDAIAEALTRLARDPALRRQMGGNGARAFAAHTPENFTRPIIEAINRTCHER